jgi:hypothetical protein
MSSTPAPSSIAARQGLRLGYPRSLALALVLALVFWAVFFPTVFSIDAFYLLLDGMQRRFSDMHSLLIPQVMSLLVSLHVNIAWVTLAQLVLGFLGVRRLATATAHLCGAASTTCADWIAVGVLVLLATPLTPLAMYLATLWSDTWLAISLLWAISLIMELRMAAPEVVPLRRILAITLCGLVVLLVRYNALLVYPFLAYAFFDVLRPAPFRSFQKALLLCLPPLLAAAFLACVYLAYPIKRMNPERAVYALDLASMIVYDPSICQDLSIHSCERVFSDFAPNFRVGDGAINFTFTEARPELYDPFLQLYYDSRLDTEFRTAALDHPLLLATVKVLNTLDYMGPHIGQYYYQKSIVANDVAQMPGQAFASPEGPWFAMTGLVTEHPVLRWFSFVHMVWFVLNVLALLLAAAAASRVKGSGLAFLWKLLLIPASYYASYFLAFTTAEFRFMYPSTLVMQVLTLSSIGAWLFRGDSRPASAPALC